MKKIGAIRSYTVPGSDNRYYYNSSATDGFAIATYHVVRALTVKKAPINPTISQIRTAVITRRAIRKWRIFVIEFWLCC
jgi:hypothetical protein